MTRLLRFGKTARFGKTGRLTAAAAVVASGLLITASAAQASWLQQDTPNVVGAKVWELAAVSCKSPSVCMAVGDSAGGTSQLLAESRSQSGWSVRAIPAASGSRLSDISCAGASSCVAVGSAPGGGSSTVPLTER